MLPPAQPKGRCHHAWFDQAGRAGLPLLFPLAVAAQAGPRDYSISPPPVRYSPDGRTAVVSFTVRNQGGDAAEPSLIVITENQSGSVEVREVLPALAAGQAQDFSIELALADYGDDDIFFKIEAGIDDYEVAGSPIARNNTSYSASTRRPPGQRPASTRRRNPTGWSGKLSASISRL